MAVGTHLQYKGLHFQTAVWTAKQTRLEFSVSFFLEASSEVINKPKRKNKTLGMKEIKACSRETGSYIFQFRKNPTTDM